MCACNPKEGCPGYLRDPHFKIEKTREKKKKVIANEKSPRQRQNELSGLKALEMRSTQSRGTWKLGAPNPALPRLRLSVRESSQHGTKE